VPPVEPEPLPDPEDDPPPLAEPPPDEFDPPELEPPELDPLLPEPPPAELLPGCEPPAPGESVLIGAGVFILEVEFPPVPPQPTMNRNENNKKTVRTTSGLQHMGPPTTLKREQMLWFD
jgi:hypothetical protein